MDVIMEVIHEEFVFASRKDPVYGFKLHKWTVGKAIIYTTDFDKWHIFDESRGTEEHEISFDTLVVIMYEKEKLYHTGWFLDEFIKSVKKIEAGIYRF